MSIPRRSPLKRSPFKRSKPMKRRHKDTGPDFWVRLKVRDRFGGRCCRCGLDGASIQHRQPRGSGGTSSPVANSPVNLLWVCGSGTTGCHGHMERFRTDAEMKGWLVRHGKAHPADVPVRLWDGRKVLLTQDGGFVPAAGAKVGL